MVGGTDRVDTELMAALGERVFCKVGAEGVYCAALPEQGLGIAVKVDDGNTARACEVVIAALIGRLAAWDDEQAALLAWLGEPRLTNRNGNEVGWLRAASALRGLPLPAG